VLVLRLWHHAPTDFFSLKLVGTVIFALTVILVY
jgi:hypothetical protein